MKSSLASTVMPLIRAEDGSLRRVCADSRKVRTGDVFLAYPGHASDGRRYIPDAIARGASAVLWEREGFDWDESLRLPNLAVDGLRGMVSDIADEVCGSPSRRLWMVGVTGTNGKTSVSQWVARALNLLGRRCAVIGTMGSGFPGRLSEAINTTPDAILLQEDLARFLEEGAEAVAMEVSSIGLDQGRVSGVRMDVAVFTNLTRDHLDYHRTMDAYAAAKAKLFDAPGLKSVVLNFDDLMGVVQARRLAGQHVNVIGYTLVPDNAAAAPAQRVLVAEHLRTTSSGMRFTVRCGGLHAEITVGLVGQFNVSNLLAVIAVLMESNYSFAQAVEAAASLTPPEGRMQTLGGIGEPLVVVDYAHTPDALEQALKASQNTVVSREGALFCVFGCGGGRDVGKRPIMGEVACRLAQRVFITSDNPRNEDPCLIIDQIKLGTNEKARSIADRRLAIQTAILEAQANDLILIAGKGHETYQEVCGERHHFSDAEEAAQALELWRKRQGAG